MKTIHNFGNELGKNQNKLKKYDIKYIWQKLQ